MNTTSIKFFYNGLKVNGEKLTGCYYHFDAETGNITISAKDYGNALPRDCFAVTNETDYYSDYHDTDSATLTPAHPLYKYARHAAEAAAMRDLKRGADFYEKRAQVSMQRDWYLQEAQNRRDKLAGMMASAAPNPGQPTAADLAAVEALNNAAAAKREAAEQERQRVEREKVLAARSAGRRYIEAIAEQHPIEGAAPVVTIQWSECPAFYSWSEEEPLSLSVAAAEIILKHYDEETAAADERGYYKTGFSIEYGDPATDEPQTYEGRYDLGDNDGGLIAHIRTFGENYARLGPYGGGNPSEEAKQTGAEIVAFAAMLKQYTASAEHGATGCNIISILPYLSRA